MLLTVALLLFACSTSAFAPALVVPARSRMPTRRALLPVASAQVLPAMYTTVGTALLVKATKAATQADGLLLATTGLLAIVNLGPVDAARLASAKRACKITPPVRPPILHARFGRENCVASHLLTPTRPHPALPSGNVKPQGRGAPSCASSSSDSSPASPGWSSRATCSVVRRW